MMRRGLWQQQKRPSACLRCRYSYGYRPYTRPALRSSSSPEDRIPHSNSLVRRPSLTVGHSTRLCSVVADRSGQGEFGCTPNPRRDAGVGGLKGPGNGRLGRRAFSKAGLPSWATQQVHPSFSDDGLLPHERTAREKAMARAQPTPPSPAQPSLTHPRDTQPKTILDGLLPHERAARERAMARPQPLPPAAPPPLATRAGNPAPRPRIQPRPAATLKNRGPAWASAPSGSAPPSQPAATSLETGKPPQQADPLAFLLPHERLAREKAAAGTKAQRPLASDTLMPQGTKFSEDTPRHSRPGRMIRSEDPWRQNHIRQIPRASIPLAQTSADEGEWKNLARRERKLPPPGFSMLSSEPWPDPFLDGRSHSSRFNTERDPLSILEQRSSGRAPQRPNSGAGVDQWALLERQVKNQAKIEEKRTAVEDTNTWDWADDYSEEARKLKAQRIARELGQDGKPVEEGTGPETAPVRRDRDDRAKDRRSDRYDREERPDRRKKPKEYRRRQVEVDDDWDDDFYEEKRRRKAEKERQRQAALAASGPTPIFLPEFISVSNLAVALGQKIDVFVTQLEELGFEDVGKDNILTGETAALVAQEFGFEPTVDSGEAEDLKPAPPAADPSSLPLRPPVVTIMGHVDHGKTTLLDYLRKSSIVSQEHGGITQHIGAFSVSLSSGKQITFLDTPGHAAFLSMRQRGAIVTDMVILVVAADDSVMPQTLEALKHARAAKVPIIVAINKVDKPEANVGRVKSDLAAHGVEIEDYGGDVQVVCVSGRTGTGMDDLEEAILTLSELLDIRAEREGMAEGWVLESTIKPIGRVATVLVKRGTLRPGDYIVAGCVHAKVRSLRNEAGVDVDEAPPGTAVEVLGWKEPPVAGDQVLQAPDEGRAKSAVRYRQELKERGEVIAQMAQQEQERREREREKALAEAESRRKHSTTDQETPSEDNDNPVDTTKYLTYLVKGDVHGSVEAVTAALLEQGNNEVRAKVLVSAPGQITESDVEHAAVSGSAIINFNNNIPSHIKRLAHEAGVRIMDHNVIYHLVEEVKERLAEALPPLVIKKVVGEAEVLQVFPINIRGRKYKNIAGCRIGNGYVRKGSKARVIRGGENVYEGVIETLKHVKKDVDEMKKGSECGMSFADWDELQVGDQIQMYEEFTEKRKL
ncbi:initiation factor 2 [Parathielavia appendiculata]|uniref:Translation initiation factor IF-2, mitochondrial n=1 Tax=Parathielavia appendiculata TaxID=2587402 RepID=A0AAN6U267_9PEZI|nr:initiation factor 2 [Parathielavia appendiculata]